MGKFLHRVGAWTFTHKWQTVGIWVAVLALFGLLASQLFQAPSNTVSIPGTQAQQTLDRFGELFPGTGKGSARIVFESRNGTSVESATAAVSDVVKRVAAVDGVNQVISPFDNPLALSKDGTIAYAEVQLESGVGDVDPATADAVTGIVEFARSNQLSVEVGGDVVSQMPGEILGIGEVAGVGIALLVLLLTLGSLVAAGMPIVIALVTVGVGIAALFSLSQAVEINATTPVLAVMLGLAVGIDYSLFIVSKYRHYLLAGYGYREAAAKSAATAGNAVIFAASTVVVALGALAVVQIPFMTTMGLAGAGTVALAAIISVTLLPALLGLAGDKIFGRKIRSAIAAAQAKGPRAQQTTPKKSIWYRWGQVITRRPLLMVIAVIVVIGAVALPVRSLDLGLPSDEFAASQSTERRAHDILVRGFGAGSASPLIIVAEHIPQVSASDKQMIRSQLQQQFDAGVAEATAAQQKQFAARAAAITTPEQYVQLQQDIAKAQAEAPAQQAAAAAKLEATYQQYSQLFELNKVAESIKSLDGVAMATPAMVSAGGTEGLIQVTSATSPSSDETSELVRQLRSDDALPGISDKSITIGVTGTTALQLDINQKLTDALPQYLGVVVGLSFLILIVAFRSILVPIKATLGFLLSVLAMFGAMVAIFQWGWFGIADAPGPIVSFIPIIAIGVLFGLAMDYEFFLVSNMHEEYLRTKDAKKSVLNGFGLGSKVVTAAGAIMVAIFAGFIFNHDAIIQTIGFGLAIGIFIDAFLVRMTLVPAVMTLLGKSAWWLPSWLDKILPHVSIEGDEDD